MRLVRESTLKYEKWIRNYISKNRVLGNCKSACYEIQDEFPELEVVAGWAITQSHGKQEHFWCVDVEGEIVDPTHDQWGEEILEYIVWNPGDEVAVGKCQDCGVTIYKKVDTLDGIRETFCDEKCFSSYAKYVAGSNRK